jgi:release factor glutamine methyltransferase
LRGGGLKVSVVARRGVPFGPVPLGRRDFLTGRGLIRSGQHEEEPVVIRGDRTEPGS